MKKKKYIVDEWAYIFDDDEEIEELMDVIADDETDAGYNSLMSYLDHC